MLCVLAFDACLGWDWPVHLVCMCKLSIKCKLFVNCTKPRRTCVCPFRSLPSSLCPPRPSRDGMRCSARSLSRRIESNVAIAHLAMIFVAVQSMPRPASQRRCGTVFCRGSDMQLWACCREMTRRGTRDKDSVKLGPRKHWIETRSQHEMWHVAVAAGYCAKAIPTVKRSQATFITFDIIVLKSQSGTIVLGALATRVAVCQKQHLHIQAFVWRIFATAEFALNTTNCDSTEQVLIGKGPQRHT